MSETRRLVVTKQWDLTSSRNGVGYEDGSPNQRLMLKKGYLDIFSNKNKIAALVTGALDYTVLWDLVKRTVI